MTATTALVLVVLILVAFVCVAVTVVGLALIRGVVEMRRLPHQRPVDHTASSPHPGVIPDHPMFDRSR